MTDPKLILNDLLNSDSFDELVIYRLNKSLDLQLEILEEMSYKYKDGFKMATTWQNYVDTLQYSRALVKVLEWFTVNDYKDTIVTLNKYSLLLEDDERDVADLG